MTSDEYMRGYGISPLLRRRDGLFSSSSASTSLWMELAFVITLGRLLTALSLEVVAGTSRIMEEKKQGGLEGTGNTGMECNSSWWPLEFHKNFPARERVHH